MSGITGTARLTSVAQKSVTFEKIEEWRLAPSESRGLEFKEARTHYDNEKLFEYCVALANEGGGYLVLGMTDKPPRTVVGSAAYQSPGGIANSWNIWDLGWTLWSFFIQTADY